MLRTISSLFLHACLPLFLFGQTSFEGTITYSITYLELPSEVQGFESMLPDELIMVYKGDKMRFEQGVMGGSQIIVMDNKANTGFILMDMMGQKIHVPMTKEELENYEDGQAEEPSIEYLSGNKNILGFDCYRAKIAGEGQDMELWYTKELDIEHNSYKSLNGFPLEYTSKQGDMKLKMLAKSIRRETIDPSFFSVPGGYDTMTLDELQQMGR